MSLALLFSRRYKCSEHFICYMVFRKFIENTNKKPIFSKYNIFYKYRYFFFPPVLWSLSNHCQKYQSNQEQCSLCSSSPCFRVFMWTHYGPLQCFATYFCKSKEIGVSQPIFPGYIISCDYALTEKGSSVFF